MQVLSVCVYVEGETETCLCSLTLFIHYSQLKLETKAAFRSINKVTALRECFTMGFHHGEITRPSLQLLHLLFWAVKQYLKTSM